MSSVRELEEKDIPILLDLFCETIQTVNQKDYSHEQVSIWGSRQRVEKGWNISFKDKHVFVYEENNQLDGFCELKNNGYIDRFYVRKNSIGQGVGRLLYEHLESRALTLEIESLFVDTSITAKPFFIKMGFTEIKKQLVHLENVEFINFRMEKSLGEV